MYITIDKHKSLPEDYRKASIISSAKGYVLSHKLTKNEISLDRYLRKTYGSGLKHTCIKIILRIKESVSADGDIVLTLNDRKLDRIYRTICYGGFGIPRSDIIYDALRVYKERR